MEIPQATPFTEVVSDLFDLSRRLIGCDKEAVRKTVSQTLQTARVNHQNELDKANTRRVHFRRKPDAMLRRITPTRGTSLLQALAQIVELNEERELRSPRSHQINLSPQAYLDRYSLEMMVESLRNPLTAVVISMMVQHDYLQREAREAFDVITQHSAAQKGDTKFYEKRTLINAHAKKRFDKSNFFRLTSSGEGIQTAAISEDEAEANYGFLEQCAHLLGQPFFSTTQFNPLEPIPALMSNGHNFDEENAVEDRRIRAVVSPKSLKNLIESLGYTNMIEKAKGPVLNTAISGNGHGGSHGTPFFEESDAEKQSEINRVIDEYVASVEFRRELKHPQLEVVVDGLPISKPFVTNSNTSCQFQLSAIAKYVQVFATQSGRRVIVSNLSLPQTEISQGKAWHSELELEGQQKVRLTVEPRMDDSGNLTGAKLVVGYQPRATLFGKLATLWTRLWARDGQLWPAWAARTMVASTISLLALAPFFTINIFSFAALVMLVLSVTGFLFVIAKVKPAWRLSWTQQVAVHGLISTMLIGMLLLGILPSQTTLLTESRVFRVITGTNAFQRDIKAAMTGFRHHQPGAKPFFPLVIGNAPIVPGSACVGLDCVHGESFGFDTIRVQENNTRIQFDDASTSAGFSANNWQIRANAQTSGSGSPIVFVEQEAIGNSETGTLVSEVDAGAPANSLRVNSTGNVGIGTATPVLDVRANTTDTPAIRVEQNNSGGFTAQTWDIGANEASFFVRDVTGGSRLPYRIRSGAPMSSVDISAAGNVGVGTATANPVNGTDRTAILAGCNAGNGTAAPADPHSVNGNASKPNSGAWAAFSDERLKNIKDPYNSGLKAVKQLQSLRYKYKHQNDQVTRLDARHVNFSAQNVQQVIPEAVSQTENGYLMVNNDPIIWTMLNAIKEQQAEIEKLKTEVRRLRATSRRRP